MTHDRKYAVMGEQGKKGLYAVRCMQCCSVEGLCTVKSELCWFSYNNRKFFLNLTIQAPASLLLYVVIPSSFPKPKKERKKKVFSCFLYRMLCLVPKVLLVGRNTWKHFFVFLLKAPAFNIFFFFICSFKWNECMYNHENELNESCFGA